MLRLHTATSAAGVKNYFKGADYYADEAAGIWGGKLAAEWGLSGTVDKAVFDLLCDNKRPDGTPLTPRTNDKRRVGDDMIFSLPKDVGAFIMLLPPEERERYLAMVERRVNQVMGVIEDDVQTRVRKDGAFENRPGDGILFAGHRHTTARQVGNLPPDPHPHWHMFTFNVTRDPQEGGRTKAADFANIYRDSAYYQALFYGLVAEDFLGLGHAIERREHGGWGLAELRPLGDTFSKRTDQIEAEAKRLNITDADAKDELGAKTRAKKQHVLSPEQLRGCWYDQLSDDERDALLRAQQKAIPAQPGITAEVAVAYAVHHCFERESVVSERELVRVALLHGVSSVTVEQIRAELPAHGVLLAEKDGRLMATTADVHRQERTITAFAAAGRGTVEAIGVSPGLDRGILDDDQWHAVTGLLNSHDRLDLVDSAAGVGKSTMLQVLNQGMRLAGQPVTYLATTTPAVGVLRQDGFAAETVAKFLLSEKMQGAAKGGCVVVDEASMLGLRDASRLFAIAKDKNLRLIFLGDSRQHSSVAAGAFMRLVQQFGGITPFRIAKIKRQKNEDHKAAVELMFAGKTLAGFDLLDEKLGWVQEIEDAEARYQAMAAEYVQARKDGTPWDKILLISPTHAEGERVTAAIRGQLRQEKLIGQEEHELTRWVSADLTEAERADARNLRPGTVDMLQFHQNTKGYASGTRIAVSDANRDQLPVDQAAKFQAYRKATVKLAVGDIIRFTANGTTLDGHQIRNGSAYQIAGFTPTAIRLANGWLVDQDFGHFKPGIETSPGSQSKTVDLAIVGQSSQSFGASNMEQAYVSASRAKYKVSTYTDDKSALRKAIQRSSQKLAAHDLIPIAPVPTLAGSWPRRLRDRQRQAMLERNRADAFVPVRLLQPERQLSYGHGR